MIPLFEYELQVTELQILTTEFLLYICDMGSEGWRGIKNNANLTKYSFRVFSAPVGENLVNPPSGTRPHFPT